MEKLKLSSQSLRKLRTRKETLLSSYSKGNLEKKLPTIVMGCYGNCKGGCTGKCGGCTGTCSGTFKIF
jgi:hypothetical protein